MAKKLMETGKDGTYTCLLCKADHAKDPELTPTAILPGGGIVAAMAHLVDKHLDNGTPKYRSWIPNTAPVVFDAVTYSFWQADPWPFDLNLETEGGATQ